MPFVFVTLIVNIFNIVNSMKRLKSNEKFSTLWHKHLGHSRPRIERLIKDEILPDLDLSYFDTYVDCIKGKLTVEISNAKVDRCTELLGIIHTDYSRYGFVELIHEKSNSLEAFKAKVELQQGKKIKVVHFDKGSEYYGRYDETRRNPGPFVKYLQECGIDAQYTMFGTPQ